ncbi:MAG TPA: pyrimidine-nucleoside phosphorylase [Actinobacteria bacterium]|nr:pyrimidine-nucleoside phosphorylase [Actinomycetota bacterium]
MRVYDIIVKKRDGERLTAEEIDFMVQSFVKEETADYQMSAFLMAAYIRGLDSRETLDLTSSMVASGEVIDLSSIPGVKVDKHSTGGVGDKTTLLLAPLVAATGVPIAKMSGRGLGHTGGTLDKLESIPGLRVDLSREEFISQVREVGVAIAGATADIVPADKKIYALRDATATVSSTPLIASSVMSKKIAGGADAIVLDVKVGSGAFMKTLGEARELAGMLVDIGRGAGKETVALITNMDEPLGFAIGNVLEVREVIDALKGKGPTDLVELCLALGSRMLVLGGVASSIGEAQARLQETLNSGEALEKFAQLVRSQGGDPRIVEAPGALPRARIVSDYLVKEEGYLSFIDAEAVGRSAMVLGAGRATKEDKIDPTVGIVFRHKVGDYIKKGDVLVEIHANDMDQLDQADTILDNAINIVGKRPEKKPLVLEIVDSR